MLGPRGGKVQVNMFCNASHSSCLSTKRSTTGIINFVNIKIIFYYLKLQNTIESSTFGSEFVTMKIAVGMNEALKYKLRIICVPSMAQ